MIKKQIAAHDQKITIDKANLCSNPVSSLSLKIRLKKIHATKPLTFHSISCFGVTKITTPIWPQKSWKSVKILKKKRQRPDTIQMLWIVKKRRPIIAPAIAVRLIKKSQRSIVKAQESVQYSWRKLLLRKRANAEAYKVLISESLNLWPLGSTLRNYK